MQKALFAVFLIFLNLAFTCAASVEIQTQVFEDQTIYTYNFYFEQNDSYRSFSFERPSDSRVDLVVDNNTEDIRYSLAGDFMIVQPKSTAGESYKIRLASTQVSQEIKNKGSFSTYTNFNFPVDNLTFKLELIDNFGEINSIFPRTYEITDEGLLLWNIENVESDTLFLLEFERENKTPSTWELITNNKIIFWGLIILLIIIILLLFYFFVARKKLRKEKDSSKSIIEEKIEEPSLKEEKKEEIKSLKPKINQNKYEEITSKFLTDNEKEVVEVVKNNQGISQYDILNHLPKMTKSNLSKIISKLNARKILNRIRVGKVNKIYLGEKLEEPSTSGSEGDEKAKEEQ